MTSGAMEIIAEAIRARFPDLRVDGPMLFAGRDVDIDVHIHDTIFVVRELERGVELWVLWRQSSRIVPCGDFADPSYDPSKFINKILRAIEKFNDE